MDIDLTASILLSSLIIGAIGMGVFLYGKKAANLRCLLGGVTLMAFPYFVHSVILMWGIAVVCLAGTFVGNRPE